MDSTSIGRGNVFCLGKSEDIVLDKIFGSSSRDIEKILECCRTQNELFFDTIEEKVMFIREIRETCEYMGSRLERRDEGLCICSFSFESVDHRGEARERGIASSIECGIGEGEREGVTCTCKSGIDETRDIILIIFVWCKREIDRKGIDRHFPPFVLSFRESGSINMIPLKSFCLMCGDELDTSFLLPEC